MEYPSECCGILLGRRERGRRIVNESIPMENMAGDAQRKISFSIDPKELVRIERLAIEKGNEIVGFYHSHPDCDANASDDDEAHMIAGYSYPIISVKQKKCVAVCSYEKKIQQEKRASREDINIEIFGGNQGEDFNIYFRNPAGICKPSKSGGN